MRAINIGMLGVGNIARLHIKNLELIPNADIIALCDIDRACMGPVSEELDANCYTDLDEMLEKEDLDLVAVTVPTFARIDEVEKIAAGGRAVFVEKPAAADMHRAQANLKAIEEAGVVNAIGYMWRYSSSLIKAQQLLQHRIIGHVVGAALCPFPPGTWLWQKARSGGQILDQVSHLINAAGMLCGPAESVFAYGTKGRLMNESWADIEECSTMAVKYQNGILGTFVNSCAYQGVEFSLTFHTDDSSLKVDLWNNTLTGTLSGVEIDYTGDDDPYLTEWNSFILAVSHNDQRLVQAPYQCGLETLAVTLAANRSMESGRQEQVA